MNEYRWNHHLSLYYEFKWTNSKYLLKKMTHIKYIFFVRLNKNTTCSIKYNRMKYFSSLLIFSGQMGGYYNPYAGSFSAAHMAAAAAAAAAQQTGQVSRSSKATILTEEIRYKIFREGFSLIRHSKSECRDLFSTETPSWASPQIFSRVRNIFTRWNGQTIIQTRPFPAHTASAHAPYIS